MCECCDCNKEACVCECCCQEEDSFNPDWIDQLWGDQ